MVSVPLNEPERERTRRKDAELFEATPEQIPPQNLEAEEMILVLTELDAEIEEVQPQWEVRPYYLCRAGYME